MSTKENISSTSSRHCLRYRRRGANFGRSGLQANGDLHPQLGCFSWDNGLKIRSNSLLVCGVNVEDIGETGKKKVVSKSRFDFIRRIGVPFALGFFNKFECKLALSCTTKAM